MGVFLEFSEQPLRHKYFREVLRGIILQNQNYFLLLCLFLFSITDFHVTVCLSLSFNFKSTAPKRQYEKCTVLIYILCKLYKIHKRKPAELN